jgi:hypothetical protein
MNLIAICIILFLNIFGCKSNENTVSPHEPNFQKIPIGGNAWVTNGAKITDKGLENWSESNQICTVYFKVNKAGKLKISVFSIANNSEIKITVAAQSKVIKLKGEAETMAGEWEILQPEYIKIQIEGIEKEGLTFGNITNLGISGSCVNSETAYVKNNEGNYFYWGRRGPSVHLNYNTDGLENIEWFYSEITVPEQSDVIGSYYMANGFKEGYFGMQVNSPTERRILFSIWSPFNTDDPNKVPEEQKIILLKKGQNVYTGEFGNEGAGGQSYLKYNWRVKNTYKFLVGAKPDVTGFTTYTAYFYAPEEKKWLLIASFKRPQTKTYLKGLYSFLENFETKTGNQVRKAKYGNQWAFDTKKGWVEINKITFTADATARIGYRKDYEGGNFEGGFYLKNCGFFALTTPIQTPFERTLKNIKPEVVFAQLP